MHYDIRDAMGYMRIAFIFQKFPTIAQNKSLNIITGLIDAGHEVDIFSFSRGNAEIVQSDVQKYGLLEKNVYLDPFSTVFDSIRDTRLALDKKLFKKIGFKLLSLKLFRFFRYGTVIFALLRSSCFNVKGAYDIVYCKSAKIGLRFLPFYRLGICGGKLIVRFNEDGLTEFVRQNRNNACKELFRDADYFLAESDYFRKRALLLGCPKSKISVLKSGIDCNRFKFKKRNKPREGVLKIVFVGSLAEEKGVEYAIQAISILKKQHYNVEFLIVGEGLLSESLRRLCRDLGIEKYVFFLGTKNHDRLVKILKTAHLFVTPTASETTGDKKRIPNVLREAMASGLPVVSTYHTGISEWVKDGVCGFLVPARDAKALANKLAYLIDHPELWSKMGTAGRRFVEENYNKDVFNRQMVDIFYRRLIS